MTIQVHHYEQRDGFPVCKYCGVVENAESVGPRYCSGKLPQIQQREPVPLNDVDARLRLLAALGHCVEVLDDLKPCGHSGDEETWEHDVDCALCRVEAALAHAEEEVESMGDLSRPAMNGQTVYVVTVCDDDGTVQWQSVYASLFDADAVFEKKRDGHGRLACLSSRRVQ